MTELLAMLALGAVCWVFRIVFVLLVPATALPARVRRGLEGRGPTPKAEDRPYHAAYKAKKAATRKNPLESEFSGLAEELNEL